MSHWQVPLAMHELAIGAVIDLSGSVSVLSTAIYQQAMKAYQLALHQPAKYLSLLETLRVIKLSVVVREILRGFGRLRRRLSSAHVSANADVPLSVSVWGGKDLGEGHLFLKLHTAHPTFEYACRCPETV
jgi:hypothetical protein